MRISYHHHYFQFTIDAVVQKIMHKTEERQLLVSFAKIWLKLHAYIKIIEVVVFPRFGHMYTITYHIYNHKEVRNYILKTKACGGYHEVK